MTQTPIDLLLSEPPASRPIVALSEGSDPRVVAGALAAKDAGIADVILVGSREAVEAALADQGAGEGEGVAIHDPATSDLTADMAAAFHELRKHKGVDEEAARKAVASPLVYAAMLVRQGHAAGTVGGAVATTSDVVRTAIQVIGKAKTAPTAATNRDEHTGVPHVTSRSFAKEAAIMFRRHATLIVRDPVLYLGRCVIFLVATLVFAFVYWNARHFTQDQAQNKLWAMIWFISVPTQSECMHARSRRQS